MENKADRNGLRRQAESIARAKFSQGEKTQNRTEEVIQELQIHSIELEMQNDELLKTQRDLEIAQNKFSDLYNFSPVGYLTINEKGKIIEANFTIAEMLGVTRQYISNKNFHQFITEDTQDSFYLYCKSLIEENHSRETCEIKLKKLVPGEISYSTFYVQLTCVVVRSDQNDSYQIKIVITDITELKNLEKYKEDAQNLIAKNEKRSELEKIAGKIAHDFNNLLMIIAGRAEFSLFDCPEGELKESFEIIHDQAIRGTKLTKELVVYAKNNISVQEEQPVYKTITTYNNKYILIVEDEDQISNMQRKVLINEPFRHNVDIAKDGHAALELIEKNRYDFITLDYILPGKFNGMHIYEHIREIDSTVPVLFISGNIEFLESIKSLRENDENIDHLPKPHNIGDYVNHVNRLIELSFNKKEA